LGSALFLVLITTTTALAKGNYSFITIRGNDLNIELRVTDPALTSDYFAFADFFQNKTEAPANPGIGYEITRYYLDQGSAQAFDQLHYYPDKGFVYYDGLVNGSSEYDGKWYNAKPGIKTAFEKALPKQASPAKKASLPITSMILTASLAVVLILAFRLRRPSAHP
jgi:hypothetical protein